ncbi:MAG: hypothetical protein K2L94_04025, partial [Alphaproteobacteria bacterium]|nr:hypothetical protein [Alphaproteobacteria bacterium]
MKQFWFMMVTVNILATAGAWGNDANAELDRKYRWSLAAMADTIDYYYKNRCKVRMPELAKMGNFLYENQLRSKREILEEC